MRAFFETEKPDYVFLATAKVESIHANSTYPAGFIYLNLMIEANIKPMPSHINKRMQPGKLHFLHGTRILRHSSIGCQQDYALDHRLGNQHSVKGILVDWRQAVDGNGMFAADFQFYVAIVQQSPPQHSRIDLEVVPTQRTFDRDFPHTGRAEQQVIAGICNQLPCLVWKLVRFARCP